MAARTNPIPSVWARQQRDARPARTQPGRDRPRGDRHAGRRRHRGAEHAQARRPPERRRDLPLPARRDQGRADGARGGRGRRRDRRPLAGLRRADPEADSPDWRAAATEAARSFRATALRHPWLSSVLGQAGLAYLGPNLMSFSERLAALFTAAGFPEPSRAIDTVLSYVIGMSTTEAAWLTTVARSGETEADFIARLMPAAQQAAAGHDHLADSYAAPLALDPGEIRETKFAYGLDVVLDGLAMRLPRD